MGDPEAHITSWEAAGVIDAATAARLRAAETTTERPSERAAAPEIAQAVAMFGPTVTIPEVFGYLGTAFLLAGWIQVVTRLAGPNGEGALGIGGLATSALLVGLGILLRGGDARRRRAAGAAFLVAVPIAAGGSLSLAIAANIDPRPANVVGALVAVALAVALRTIHPAVLTQVGLLAALTLLSSAILGWIESLLIPDPGPGIPVTGGSGSAPLVMLVISAAWWLGTAVLIGLIGLREADASEHDPAASRRAAISRFSAGVTAVAGLSQAVVRNALQPNGEYDRVLEPWLGELLIVVVSIVLLERAFRRDATSFVYAAALGLIIALSDFNFTYLSDTTEVGLVVEGVILLVVGIAADRLRRRIRGAPPAEAPSAGGPKGAEP